MTPARAAGAGELTGRWAKAQQFADAAELHYDEARGAADLADAFVSLAVLAGIAAADVICIAKLGRYSATGNHRESVDLLKAADSESAKHLERLLNVKTKAGYTHRPVSAADVATALRAYRALVAVAETLR